jgi:uncharacterized membrane protein YdjX (TVP38/TMEM64 family)
MRQRMRIEVATRPWRSPVVLGVLVLVVLAAGTFFFVRALGGVQEISTLLGHVQTLGQRMRDLVEQTGAWAPLTYVWAKAIIFIFVPWLGYPLNVAAGALFGLYWGVLLTAIGDTLGACVLFLLSRWTGRPAVARLVGEDRMARIDKLLDFGLGGWRELLFVRVVVPIPFNLVSLAAGLVPKLSLRDFIIVTFLTALPKVFTVGIGAGLVTGDWVETVVAMGLVVIAVAALLTRRRVREALVRFAGRWRREEESQTKSSP